MAKSTDDSLSKAPAATERYIAELAAIIRADIGALFDANGQPKRLQDLPEDVRLALAEVEVEPISGTIRSAKFKDKVNAAEKFLRLCGRDKDPEVVALLKAARQNQQRISAFLEAAKKMRLDDDAPPNQVN